MKKHHPYDNVIEGKLAQLSAAETDLLWNDMHAILDKKMPQKKERRPFVAWFLSTPGFLVANFLFLAIIGSTLFFISTKEDSTVTQTQVDSTAQFNRIIDHVTRKGSQHEPGTPIAANDSHQKSVSVISSKTFSAGAVDYIVNNGIAKPQSTKQLQKYMLQDQRNEDSQDISIARADIDMLSVKPKSMSQDILGTNKKNEEKDSLRKQPEPVANNKKPNPNKNNQKGFYTGIISGIDLSSIHFRSAKPGSTKGFIIGYAFNKKWSIESGLFWDTKRIHDNGSYFNSSGYTLSSSVTITAVNGKSRLSIIRPFVWARSCSGVEGMLSPIKISPLALCVEAYEPRAAASVPRAWIINRLATLSRRDMLASFC